MFELPYLCEHRYNLVANGFRKKVDYEFQSRQQANRYMYKLMEKNNLVVVKQYNDKHIRTYICNDGVTFYVSRL